MKKVISKYLPLTILSFTFACDSNADSFDTDIGKSDSCIELSDQTKYAKCITNNAVKNRDYGLCYELVPHCDLVYCLESVVSVVAEKKDPNLCKAIFNGHADLEGTCIKEAQRGSNDASITSSPCY